MGNTNVTASYPEAVAKFSKTELAGLGSAFRKMTTAQVAGGSGAPRSAGASTGQLTFREFYRSLKKYYQVDLACGLFRVAVELSSQAHLAQMPAFTRHQTLTRTEASATASLSSTTEGAASSREPPTDGVDCAIGRAKALRVQSLIAELEGVTCDYEGIVRMLAMTCRFAETEYAVQVLLQGFAPQATQQRFTRETLHMVVAALCTSAAGTLGLDLLSEKAAEQPLTTEEIDLGVNAMVTRAFTGITKLTLTFEQTCRFFNGERQLLAYLKYGLQYLYFVFDKKDDPENSRIPYPAELSLRRIPLPPKLLRIRGKTLLDDPADAAAVTSWLPGYLRDASLVHLYSSNEDGFAASTLIFLCGRKDRNLVKDPLLLLVQDYEDNVFGFFSPVPLHPHGNNKFYGTKAVFLFKLRPGPPKRYAATLRDENFLFTTAEGGIGVGGDRGYHGLFLDNEFYFGYFRRTETFLNEEVSETSAFKFQCKHVEAWAFIQNDRLEFFNPEPAEEDDDGLEPLRTDVSKKSILNQAGGAFLLEMMNAGSAAAQAASHA